jgi:hypothetical protein
MTEGRMNGGQQNQTHQIECRRVYQCADGPNQARGPKTLVKVMQRATSEKPKMWGPSIVGFGSYHYKHNSGREADMPLAGFSPRKAAIVLYIMTGFSDCERLLARLGKHTTGEVCLYVKKLTDVDQKVLEELVVKSVAAMRARYASSSTGCTNPSP